MYSKEQLMNMKKKIIIRIANYFNIKGISRWKKEDIVDAILRKLNMDQEQKQKIEDENVQMSVRIRRINSEE